MVDSAMHGVPRGAHALPCSRLDRTARPHGRAREHGVGEVHTRTWAGRATPTLTPTLTLPHPHRAHPDPEQVQANTMDEEDEDALSAHTPLVLCPSTFQPGKKGRFRIVVMTERPLAAPPTPLEPLRDLRLRGEWREGNAGGCRNHVTWRQNEQYMLRLNRAARRSCSSDPTRPRRERGGPPRYANPNPNLNPNTDPSPNPDQVALHSK